MCDDGAGNCTFPAAVAEANADPGSEITVDPSVDGVNLGGAVVSAAVTINGRDGNKTTIGRIVVSERTTGFAAR